MNDIFVAGHRNPDMDSTCSATAYAALKNAVDTENHYRAIRSGPLNPQIRQAYVRAGIEPPEHFDSILPTVDFVAHKPEAVLHGDDPILEAVKLVRERTISAIPVFDRNERFLGIIGVNEIADYMLATHDTERPVYTFQISNFEKVLPGRRLKCGAVPLFTAPIMTGSMPLKQTIERLSTLTYKPLLVVGNRTEIIAFAVENQLPAIVITGVDDPEEIEVSLEGYEGAAYLSATDTAESIRLVRMSSPVSTAVNGNTPRLDRRTPFDEAKRMLLDSPFRGLPVFDGEEFFGMVTRRSFIERPRRRLILVDHNELPQAVSGSEHAQIIEIVDHHRLSAPVTSSPIVVTTRPVGSTCTLVFQEYTNNGVKPDTAVSVLLLSGILSDTVNLNSPTTTHADRAAVARLEMLTGLRADAYAIDLFSQLEELRHREPGEIAESDFKTYEHSGIAFGIGQVEVTTLADSDEYVGRLKLALQNLALKRSLSWALLMVTDVMKRNSLLISSGYSGGEKLLQFHREADGLFFAPEVVSRKKQLLPEIIRVLDDVNVR